MMTVTQKSYPIDLSKRSLKTLELMYHEAFASREIAIIHEDTSKVERMKQLAEEIEKEISERFSEKKAGELKSKIKSQYPRCAS